jgi:predicted nucleic acid-binding protein
MKPAYYDTTFLLKLQIVENGTHEVRSHASTVSEIHTAQHARAELISAAFRKVREGAATTADLHRLIAQLRSDVASGAIVFLPLTHAIIDRVEHAYLNAPATTYLRAADALHLATAAEYGFAEIHSNDTHLLHSADLFGLTPVNLICGKVTDRPGKDGIFKRDA